MQLQIGTEDLLVFKHVQNISSGKHLSALETGIDSEGFSSVLLFIHYSFQMENTLKCFSSILHEDCSKHHGPSNS